MGVLTGLFFIGLFKVTEKIFDKVFDAAWEPVDESLKARFKRWAGKGKEKEREAAFTQAIATAHARTLQDTPDQTQAEVIFEAINAAENERVATALAELGSQTLLVGGAPDVGKLESAVSDALTWDFYNNRVAQPTPEQVAILVANFLHHLHDALLDQEIFYSLREAEMIKILRRIEAQGQPATPYASEAEYRAQVIEVDGRLDFTGMAVAGRREAVRVDRMFAHLQLKPESGRYTEPPIVPEDELLPRNEAAAHLMARRAREGQPPFPTTPLMPVAMQEGKPIVILGDPGSGKSTLLKYLAVLAADGHGDPQFGLDVPAAGPLLPIFIPLRRFASEAEGSLSDFFEEQTRERYDLNLPPGFIKNALRAGRCLVLLDGLDEVWERGKRSEVRDAVHALVTHPQYRQNQYIITSRISGYNAAPLDQGMYPHYEVQPLADEDIRTFIRTWYRLREADVRLRDALTAGLIEALENQANIQELARNPLLLTIIALVHRNEADLPQERATLYQKCVQTLLDEWEGRKKLTMAEKNRPFYAYREDLLELLAFDLHAGAEQPRQLQPIAREPLETKLADFMVDPLDLFANRRQARPEAETFVRFIADRVGLLVARGQDEFSFAHLTFQEYLAARDIYHRTQGNLNAAWDEIKNRLHNAHWREVILLLLALLGKEGRGRPSTDLLRWLLAAGDADPFEEVLHRHLYLAAQAVADKVNMATMVKEEIINRLFKIITDRPRWEQGDAFTALSQLEGDPQVAAGLLGLAGDPQVDAEVCRAALALGQLGRADEAVTNGLLGLAGDPQVDAGVRRYAVLALGRLGRTDEAVVVGLLGLAGDPQVDAEVCRAAQALGQLGRADQAAVAGLLGLAGDSQVAVGVRRGAQALGQLGRADEAVVTGLLGLAGDPQVDAGVRRYAALALGQLGRTDEAAEILLGLAGDPQVDAGVRRNAAQALGQLGRTDEAAEILLGLVGDPQVDVGVRRAALALGQLGRTDEAVTNGLLGLAGDPQVDAGVRRYAALALGRLSRADEAVVVGLLGLAGDPQVDAGVRRGAAQALEQLGRADEAVVTGLLGLAGDPQVDAWVRRAAAQALGQLGQADEAAEILLGLAGDPQVDAGVRRGAAQALGQLGRADEAAEILLGLARDPQVDDFVRSDAAQALGQLGRADEAVAAGLLGLVGDPQVDAGVRRAAAQALGQLGRADEAVAAGLLGLAADPQVDAGVRRYAAQALRQLLDS